MRRIKPGWENTWHGMLNRCENPKACNYKWYGGKGITVCREWHDKDAFETWVKESGWREGYTIDRIDGNKGYCPENCRWATMHDQTRNRTTNVFITYKGETRCIKDWADVTGIGYNTLYMRYKSGIKVDDIFSIKDARCRDKDINIETIRRKGNESVLHGYVRRAFKDRHGNCPVEKL